MVVDTVDEVDVMEVMRRRVDRLMKAIQIEMKDSELRIMLITRLLEVRGLLNGRD